MERVHQILRKQRLAFLAAWHPRAGNRLMIRLIPKDIAKIIARDYVTLENMRVLHRNPYRLYSEVTEMNLVLGEEQTILDWARDDGLIGLWDDASWYDDRLLWNPHLWILLPPFCVNSVDEGVDHNGDRYWDLVCGFSTENDAHLEILHMFDYVHGSLSEQAQSSGDVPDFACISTDSNLFLLHCEDSLVMRFCVNDRTTVFNRRKEELRQDDPGFSSLMDRCKTVKINIGVPRLWLAIPEDDLEARFHWHVMQVMIDSA